MTETVQALNGHAYLFLEVQPGESNYVANELVKLDSSAVHCAAAVWGPWDVVAHVMLSNMSELLRFVDNLRAKTRNEIIRTETWCIRSDQEKFSPIDKPDQLAFVMLRVDPKQGGLKGVLEYVCTSSSSDDAKVLHAAGVLGPYDIATTVSYSNDGALTELVMNRFQREGKSLGITDTLTIPSIAGMLYPESKRGSQSHRLSQEARELAVFGVGFAGKFPKAAEEIEQARRCFAHGLDTACVFHLMRVAEVGLCAVWKSLDRATSVKDARRNWGYILGDIRDENSKRNKNSSSWAGSKEERFLTSVHAMLTSIKESWRNPTMHLEHTYAVEDARGIFNTVRSCMTLIASRMDEKGLPIVIT